MSLKPTYNELKQKVEKLEQETAKRRQVEEALQSRVVQVVGSWQEGTAMTIILPKSMGLADILNTLRGIPEVAAVEEKPPNGAINPKLIKKADAVPRTKNRPRQILFITLANSWSGVAS